MLKKKSDLFLLFRFFNINFLNFSLSLHQFSFYYFSKLPTIACYWVTQVYSRQIMKMFDYSR